MHVIVKASSSSSKEREEKIIINKLRDFIFTWLAKPTPIPNKIRPMISIAILTAAALMIAPAKKTKPPMNMDIFLPNFLVTHDAQNDATSAAKYREDVNMVSFTLSNLQYWFVDWSNASL